MKTEDCELLHPPTFYTPRSHRAAVQTKEEDKKNEKRKK
jgi:hypothetical protein